MHTMNNILPMVDLLKRMNQFIVHDFYKIVMFCSFFYYINLITNCHFFIDKYLFNYRVSRCSKYIKIKYQLNEKNELIILYQSSLLVYQYYFTFQEDFY